MKIDLKQFIILGMTATVTLRVVAKPITVIARHQYFLILPSLIGMAIGAWVLRAFCAEKKWARYFLGWAYLICGLIGGIGDLLPTPEKEVRLTFELLLDLWYLAIGALVVWGLGNRSAKQNQIAA